MHDLISKSLAQIVNSNHHAAAVFEKYRLDFCCKGKRTLEQACTESNLDAEEVLSAIEQAKPANSCTVSLNFEELSLARLSGYIVNTHHSYVKKEMPLLLGYLQKIASKHGNRHPEMLKVLELFTAVKEEMEHHMQKEELVLFPRITDTETQVNQGRELVVSSTYLLSPVTIMEQEHDHAGSMLAEIRKLTNDYNPPADACTTYRLSFAALQAFELDLHQHVHLENNILFPRALRLFGNPGSPSLN